MSWLDGAGIVGFGFAIANTFLGLGAGFVHAILGSPELVVAILSLADRVPIVSDVIPPGVLDVALSIGLVTMFSIHLIRLGRLVKSKS